MGNPWMGDDAFGPRIVDRIANQFPTLEAIQCPLDASSLIAAWTDRPATFVVDAMLSGDRPGTVRCFEPADLPPPRPGKRSSTHGWGLRWAIALSERLGVLPTRLMIIGVAGRNFSPGTELRLLDEAARTVADCIENDLRRAAGRNAAFR